MLLAGKKSAAQQELHGHVYDENIQALEGAIVTILPDNLQCISDGQGQFYFDLKNPGDRELVIRLLGYQQERIHLGEWSGAKHLDVELTESQELLPEIHIVDEHHKQEDVLSHEHKTGVFFQSSTQNNFSEIIAELPGIHAQNVGVGIAKPVVRGLSSNRITVNHMGIKQQGQQWGSDHGLELDAFDIEDLEIIKGAGTIQYGSDAFGGVINVRSDRIPEKNTIDANAQMMYKSNNNHLGASAKISANKNNGFFNFRVTHQSFGDFQIPISEFDYNGFTLPIYDQSLKNTAGKENNYSLTIGKLFNNSLTKLHFSHYSLLSGLFSGAVGIPRSYLLEPDNDPRGVDIPSQEVKHTRFTLNQMVYFGHNHWAMELGYQKNQRAERSRPEFHSIPVSQQKDDESLALGLELETFTLNSHYEYVSSAKNNKWIVGGNAELQRNVRSGFEFLMPDFQTQKMGAFLIHHRELGNDYKIVLGMRVDANRNRVEYFRQNVWNSSEEVIDSLIAEEYDRQYLNGSLSAGISYDSKQSRISWKANLSRSYRVPYPNETSSNGVHHGNFRHERGQNYLKEEIGYQFDLGAMLSQSQWSFNLDGYFYYFQDYIYLGPSFPAEFSTIPEAGLIYEYRQDNAIYTGMEATLIYHSRKWEWRHDFDFVQSYNLSTQLALPFTPPANYLMALNYYPFLQNSVFSKWQVNLSYRYIFAAEGSLRVDRNERETPASNLINIKTSVPITFAKHRLSFAIGVNNVFNESYLAHLSRYRLLNIPEQGRNWIVSLKYEFN